MPLNIRLRVIDKVTVYKHGNEPDVGSLPFLLSRFCLFKQS